VTPTQAGWAVADDEPTASHPFDGRPSNPAPCPGSGQLIAWPGRPPGGWVCPICADTVAVLPVDGVLTLARHNPPRPAATADTLPLWG
jgi:hypothetical protein